MFGGTFMYYLDPKQNKLVEITETTFYESDIKEREHIEEWMRKNPEVLEEELLIIGHEYDRFEVNERLDLLAIDKEGNLVIIEVKRDVTGGHVDFQALKYASYCSKLSPSDILEIYTEYIQENGLELNATDELMSFLEVDDQDALNNVLNSGQRIIIIGKEIDKRILSVCAWLYENNIDIKCMSIKPYHMEDRVIVDINQIVPPYRLEDFYVNKKVRQSGKKINVDGDISGFLQTVADEINKSTEYNVTYNGTRSYFLSKQLPNVPLKYVYWYGKKVNKIGISIETYKPEGQVILQRINNQHIGKLKEMISPDWKIEFEQGGKKNSDKYTIGINKVVPAGESLRDCFKEYFEMFIVFNKFLKKYI
jgi:hypothetical protein